MNSQQETIDPLLAVDLALLPTYESCKILNELNSLAYSSWKAGVKFSDHRIPHLTLFQGALTSQEVKQMLADDFFQTPGNFELDGLANFSVPISKLNFQDFDDDLAIQMLNLECPLFLKQFQMKCLDILDRHQQKLFSTAEKQNSISNLRFFDSKVHSSVPYWVIHYSRKRRSQGFSPHITLGFGKRSLYDQMRAMIHKHKVTQIQFDRIVLAQLGDFCTVTNNFYWEHSLSEI